MIEALACGTPVIAWRRGSVPEVVEDGVTGYVVDSIDDAVEARGRARIASIGRRAGGPSNGGSTPGAWPPTTSTVYRRVAAAGRRGPAGVTP